jgi:hypothetical protein
VISPSQDLYLTALKKSVEKTPMTQAGFEPAIPSSEPPQTQMLHRAATGITKIHIKKNFKGRIYDVIEVIFRSFFCGD